MVVARYLVCDRSDDVVVSILWCFVISGIMYFVLSLIFSFLFFSFYLFCVGSDAYSWISN